MTGENTTLRLTKRSIQATQQSSLQPVRMVQLQSFTLKQLFSEESCSVVGLSEEMSFQHRSELSATVER